MRPVSVFRLAVFLSGEWGYRSIASSDVRNSGGWVFASAFCHFPLPCGTSPRSLASTAPPAAAEVTPFYLMRHILVLNLPAPFGKESQVQRQVSQQRERQAQRRRRKKRFRLNLSPAPPAAKKFTLFGKPIAPTVKTMRDTYLIPPDQQQAVAQGLFADALVQQLRDRQRIFAPTEEEISAALQALGLTPSTAALPANAARLCARLGCQAMLIPHVAQVTVQDRVTRDAMLFAEVRVEGTPSVKTHESMPDRVRGIGVAHASHKWFHAIYLATQGAVLSAAAQDAAAMVLHTLRTGHAAPFASPSTRVGIAPVPAPASADELQFRADGRRVVPKALSGLPTEVTELFVPDLLPLPSSATRTAVGVAPLSLWTGPDGVDLPRARALARKMGVDYLMLARVTGIELASSPPRSLTLPTLQNDAEGLSEEARAEAVGALIRASDGALLWQDHASAAQATPSRNENEVRRTITRAVHYALVALTSQFAHYRETFTN